MLLTSTRVDTVNNRKEINGTISFFKALVRITYKINKIAKRARGYIFKEVANAAIAKLKLKFPRKNILIAIQLREKINRSAFAL
jgi:hypothetical protein